MRRALIILFVPLMLQGQTLPPGSTPSKPSIPPEMEEVWQQYEQLVREHPDHPLLHYNFGNLVEPRR